MIAFATLLLGIAFGIETLELRVGEGVSRVDLVLDGAVVSSVDQPPWRAQIDLGPRPTPHHLEAVAWGADAQELGRTEQWINLPQSAAEASIVLERLEDGGAVARVAWESLANAAPIRIEASFDGRDLDVPDPTRIVLPPYDDGALHFLRIELVFSESISSVIERTIGGTYTESVMTELTAVPVVVSKPFRKAKADAFRDLLTIDDKPLDVVAVESGPSLAVMVVDRTVWDDFGRQIASRLSRHQRAAGNAWTSLRRQQRLRFLWPVSQRHLGASRSYDLFNLSETFEASVDGIYYLMRHVSRPLYLGTGPQRLADAVINAGLEAASRRRSRAVVLLLGQDPEDSSQLTADQVRSYLDDLQVPLLVWTTSAETVDSVWGEATPILDPLSLERASRQLSDRLREQRIVWVQGIHLPQAIRLTPEARELGLQIAR